MEPRALSTVSAQFTPPVERIRTLGGARARGLAWSPLVKRSFLIGLTLLLGACQDAALESHAQLPQLTEALQPFGVTLEVAPTSVTTLAYQTPSPACDQVYRIRIDNEPDIMHEEDSESFLSLGHPPPKRATVPTPAGPLASGEIFTANVYYKGIRAERVGVLREGYLSARHAGPTSPTAGCLPQTWDPIEDSMTLGWPKLTGRLTGVQERWTGLRVAGKCNRAACVDPKTGGGGPENHDRTCVTQDWQNRLVGVFEHQGERLALVHSTWTDGHGEAGPGNTTGIWGERVVLLSVDHGRPVWARHDLQHNFVRPTADKRWAPIHRTWEMQSVDECPGSLASLGWERPPAVLEAVQAQRDALADPETIREQIRRKPRDGNPTAPPVQPGPAEPGEPYIVPVPKTSE